MKEKLHTEDDYRIALARFLNIIGAPEGSPESIEIKQLIILLEEYEKENC